MTAGGQSNRIVETGIKVIDVMCPIRAGGSVAIAGEYGTGNTVNMEELVQRISGGSDPVTLFLFLPPPSEIWPPSLDENYSLSAELKEEGYSEGTVGCVLHSLSAVKPCHGLRRNSLPSHRSTPSFNSPAR